MAKKNGAEREERTDEDIFSRAGEKVLLGGEEFTLYPQVIAKSREWRKKIQDLLEPLQKSAEVSLDITKVNAKVLLSLLKEIVVGSIDQVIDLVFEYSGDLQDKREWIENNATDQELFEALGVIIRFVFPFDKIGLGWKATGTAPVPTARKI